MSKLDSPVPPEAATISKTFVVAASPDHVWAALRDVHALPTRLAAGFVTNSRRDGDDRLLTFANGMEARERILAVDEALRRVVYSVISEQMSFHRASATVTARADGQSEFTWTAQVAPAELAPGMDAMMEIGAAAIKHTLETTAAGV